MSQNLDFDLVIIGSGPGGYVAAVRAGQLGLKTAIIEKDKSLGGTCLLRGCIPTKALLQNASIYEQIKNAKEFGISTGEVTLDFGAVQKRKDKVVTQNSRGVDFLMKKNKVQVIHGIGRIEAPGRVTVTDKEGKTQALQTKNILIATGSVPRSLPGVKLNGTTIITSDEALELKQIPRSMIVLGAGAVGVEFASIYSRFGARITLIELLPRILPLEDEEICAELEKALKRQMKIMTNTQIESADTDGQGVQIKIKGNPDPLNAEILLVAVGRGPYTDGLGLENVEIETVKGYIPVDEFMRTGASGIYAIGDVVAIPNRAHPQLAHLASFEGILAVEHMAGKEVRPINYDQVPSCTYCEPEVASVGLTEAEARRRGYDVRVGRFPFSANSRARIMGESAGLVKIVSEARYDEVLGVHMVGPHVTDMIAEAGVALKLESTSVEIFKTIHAHPTLTEAVMEAAHATRGEAIHF